MDEDGSGMSPDTTSMAIKAIEALLLGMENGSIEVDCFLCHAGTVETTLPEAQVVTRAFNGERHYYIGVRDVPVPLFTERAQV